MDVQHLRCIVAVAQYGSFTRAAVSLHTTQSSVSHTIAKVENQLGLKLFNRSPKGVVPTPAGESLLVPARQVLRAMEDAEATVSRLHGVTVGTLRVAPSRTFTAPLASLAVEFRRRFPEVALKIGMPQTDREIMESVASGAYDVGLARIDEPIPGLDVEVVAKDRLAVVMPRRFDDDPENRFIEWDTVAKLPLIVPCAGGSSRDRIDRAFAARGITPKIVVENDDFGIALELVRAGIGAHLTTTRADVGTAGILKQISPVVETRVGVVSRPGALSPAALAFKQLTGELLKDGRHEGSS